MIFDGPEDADRIAESLKRRLDEYHEDLKIKEEEADQKSADKALNEYYEKQLQEGEGG